MRFDIDAFDQSAWDLLIETSVAGLKVFRCVNWAEGDTHGGEISEYEVDSIFDTITAAQNQAGHTDYRKMFFNASDTDITGKTYRAVLNAPNAVLSRVSLSIVKGTASDDMSNKPSDESFGDTITDDISLGESMPVWIKRTITAASSDLIYYRNVSVSLTVSA